MRPIPLKFWRSDQSDPSGGNIVSGRDCCWALPILDADPHGKSNKAVAEDGDGARRWYQHRPHLRPLGISTACVCIAGAMMTPFFYIAPTVNTFTLTAFVVFFRAGQPERPVRRASSVWNPWEILMPEAALKQVATFTIFTLILLFRPNGLFGTKLT